VSLCSVFAYSLSFLILISTSAIKLAKVLLWFVFIFFLSPDFVSDLINLAYAFLIISVNFLLIIVLTLLSKKILSFDFNADSFISKCCFSEFFVSTGDWGVVFTNLFRSYKVWLPLFVSAEPSFLPSKEIFVKRLLNLNYLLVSGSVNTVCANCTFFCVRGILLESVFSLKEGKIDSADFLSVTFKSNSFCI